MNGCKVFSATMFEQRSVLGETVTKWLAEHPTYKLDEIKVTQSSDHAFHCLAITIWFTDPAHVSRKVG